MIQPIATSVSRYATASRFDQPKLIDTSLRVGTTTIMFGETRYGPSAPFTFQFGK